MAIANDTYLRELHRMVRKESFTFRKEDRPDVQLMTIDSKGRKALRNFKIGGVYCDLYGGYLTYSLEMGNGVFMPSPHGPRLVTGLRDTEIKSLYNVVQEYSSKSISRGKFYKEIVSAFDAMSDSERFLFNAENRPSILIENSFDDPDSIYPFEEMVVVSVFSPDEETHAVYADGKGKPLFVEGYVKTPTEQACNLTIDESIHKKTSVEVSALPAVGLSFLHRTMMECLDERMRSKKTHAIDESKNKQNQNQKNGGCRL